MISLQASQSPDVSPSVEDRLDIQEVICSVTLFSDLGEIDAAASLFTETAILDYSSLYGADSRGLAARDFWASVKELLPGFDANLHQVTNFHIRISGNIATADSAVRSTHRIADKVWVCGGIYHHGLVKQSGGWRITRLKYDHLFDQGENLAAEARRRVAAAHSSV
jgi:hypothetical protein